LPVAREEGEFEELKCQGMLGNSAFKEASKEHFTGKIFIHFCGHALSNMLVERDSWHFTVSALVMAAPSSLALAWKTQKRDSQGHQISRQCHWWRGGMVLTDATPAKATSLRTASVA